MAEWTRPIISNLSEHISELPICKRFGCTPCTSLIRRYRPTERRGHYEHVDGHAAATAVISLSRSHDFSGGLYLSNLTDRRLLRLDAGDAVFHTSDLFHGVHVQQGERWSWIIWFRTDPHCTMAGSQHWFKERAEVDGDPLSQFLHASRAGQMFRSPQQRHATSAQWLNRSAHGGFAPAMHALGNAHAKGEGVPASPREAAYWLERAVRSSGSASLSAAFAGGPSVGSRAAFDLATLLMHGEEHGWPSPLAEGVDPSARAMELLVDAAADGHVRAEEALARRADADAASA